VVRPRSADGQLIKLAPLDWTAAPTTLSADARRWPDGAEQPRGEQVLTLELEGWEVDQSSGGNAPCRPVTPGSWTVAIHATVSLTTPNVDRALAGQRGAARSLFGCRGHILAEGIMRVNG
jgi:hypothetical protein